MAVRVGFYCWGSILAPFLALLISAGIWVELGYEGLDVILVLIVQEICIEVFS